MRIRICNKKFIPRMKLLARSPFLAQIYGSRCISIFLLPSRLYKRRQLEDGMGNGCWALCIIGCEALRLFYFYTRFKMEVFKDFFILCIGTGSNFPFQVAFFLLEKIPIISFMNVFTFFLEACSEGFEWWKWWCNPNASCIICRGGERKISSTKEGNLEKRI